MKAKISLKKVYIATDAWRGYYEPKYAVCGANNTGNYLDSPCPETVCLSELRKASQILRKNDIPYKRTWCNTSNGFCIHGYLVVSEADVEKARELIKPLVKETRLLYVCKIKL